MREWYYPLLKLHNGTITVKNNPIGTSFLVELPIA